MSFGAPAGKISQNTNHSVNVAEKLNNKGDITDMTSYGGKKETTVEEYGDSITNSAVNGQTGTSVISAHNFIESNTDYARLQKTTVESLATAA
jgi:hypothetical protein